ncbi:aminoglycoside phosphotransferase family protein, partial [Raoultella ornithinolytica]|uniref:aminoglycoside phosphotransferase family protein n=1 Tax=Raoultella ornithinolytica TaxID=54291 RepID=UPI0020CF48A2
PHIPIGLGAHSTDWRISLAQGTESLGCHFALSRNRPPGCQTDYVHAAIIADQMMSNASELRGLHGDLHHENIMFSSRGWLVIDPVGLVGEVGFGAANMFYDPADRDDLCLDPRRIAQMADAFSRALDVDPRRLLDQAYAYGCLSAAWNADGEEEQRDLAIAAAIKQVRQTSY